jgi:hypothetical protein
MSRMDDFDRRVKLIEENSSKTNQTTRESVIESENSNTNELHDDLKF